jgi:hypothetical protein
MSQAVFDFYASNEFVEYPFADRQSDGYHRLFVDAFVAHDSDNPGLLRLASFDPAGYLTLTFDDESILASLTPADGFVSREFGRYSLFEWRKRTTTIKGFAGPVLTVRLVVVSRSLNDFAFPRSSSTSYLNPARVNPSVRRMTSYAVAEPGEECCPAPPGVTALVLQSGFNAFLEPAPAEIEIEEAPAVPRSPTKVVIHLDAGGGLGTYPVCESPFADLKTLGSAGPDANGNFSLDTSDCTWAEARLSGPVEPPIHPNTDYLSGIRDLIGGAFLQLHQGCRACCDCDDYGRAYRLISDIWNRASIVADRLRNVSAAYSVVRGKWESEKATRETGRGINIRLLARPDFYVDMVFTVTNNSADPLAASKLKISLDPASNPEPVYVDGTGYAEGEGLHNFRADPLVEGLGIYGAELPAIGAGLYAAYKMSVRYVNGPRAGKAVLVTLNVEDVSGGGSARWAQAGTVLLKPLEKS